MENNIRGQFEALAEYYDRFNGADYKKYAAYVKHIMSRIGFCDGSAVLDMACGTGGLTTELSALGYDMVGLDLSSDMLSEASRRAFDLGLDIIFTCQDMRKFDLYSKVEGVVCSLDGINYLMTENDLKKCFANVGKYLVDGGVFLFDVNTPWKFENVLDGRDYFLKSEDSYLGWKSFYDRKTKLCDFYLTLFTKNSKGAYNKTEELQSERCWDMDVIKSALEQCGFQCAEVYSDLDMNVCDESSEKWFFVCVKKGS